MMRNRARCMLRCAAILAAAVAMGCSSDERTVLTVYSPHGKDLLGYFETEFEKAHPKIDVQWVDMGSQEVLDRVRAEKENPQADLWFGAPAEAFDRATKENLLEPYIPTWSNAVSAEGRDPADHWYGTYLTPEVIGYNTEAVSREEAPKDEFTKHYEKCKHRMRDQIITIVRSASATEASMRSAWSMSRWHCPKESNRIMIT